MKRENKISVAEVTVTRIVWSTNKQANVGDGVNLKKSENKMFHSERKPKLNKSDSTNERRMPVTRHQALGRDSEVWHRTEVSQLPAVQPWHQERPWHILHRKLGWCTSSRHSSPSPVCPRVPHCSWDPVNKKKKVPTQICVEASTCLPKAFNSCGQAGNVSAKMSSSGFQLF